MASVSWKKSAILHWNAAETWSQQAALTPISWAAAKSGLWSSKTNWTPSAVPTAANAVTIGVTGTYTVTIGSPSAAGSLTVSASGASIADNSTLTIATSLDLAAGTFLLNSGGVIAGATITVETANFVAAGGTLSGVTFEGTLDLTEDFQGQAFNGAASLTVTNGTTFSGPGGSGAGTINLASTDIAGPAYLYALGNYTLDHAVLNIGSDNYFTSASLVNEDAAGGATLTLGPNLTINLTNLEAAISSSDNAHDEIVNKGTINAAFAGGALYIDATSFTNAGIIAVSNGAEIVLTGIESASLTNSITRSSGGLVGIGGSITGGTIDASNTGIVGAGGTLSGVTFQGTLDLTEDFQGEAFNGAASLTVTGTTTFVGAGGAATGTIDLASTNIAGDAYLYALGNYTLDHAVLNIGSDEYFTSASLVNQDAAGGATLTLGPNLTVNLTNLEAAISSSDNTGDAIVNQGTINAGVTEGVLYIDATSFTNSGTIAVSNGCEIVLTGIESASLTNSITRSSGGLVGIGGSITGGTLDASGTGIVGAGGTLSGVTVDGTLDLTEDFQGQAFSGAASLTLTAGTSFFGAGGSGVGTINLASTNLSGDASLYALGNDTLDNAVLNIGSDNNFTSATLVNQDAAGGATLTLGSNLTINLTNLQAEISSSDNAGDAIINKGTITAGYSTGILTVSAATFTNSGTITATGGGTLAITSATLTNRQGGSLVGGSFAANAGSVIQLPDNTSITTDLANIILGGAGSVIEALNTSTGHQVSLDTTLNTIGASGTLQLLAGRNLTAAHAVTDSGALVLSAGSFTASNLTIGSTGSLVGSGKLSAPIADSGRIEARGGQLTVTGAITGTGALQIDAAGTLDLAASTTSAETLAYSGQGGVLKLETPTAFASPISGYAAGDVVNLAAATATSAAIVNNATLAITLSTGATLDYALTNTPANQRVGISPDGHSITAYREAVATVSPAPAAFGNVHVGSTATLALSLTNIAPADGYSESLDATLATTSPGITASGTVTQLAAGATDSTDLHVGIAPTASGAISGSATLTLSSDGTGIDGNGPVAIGTQTVAVTGAAYNYAAATLAAATVNFGIHHVGDSVSQTLMLTNTAPTAGGYSEALDASFAAASTGVTASGAITGLAAGSSNSTALKIGLSTTTAGTVTNGTATLSLSSDGTGIDGLGTTALPSQQVTVTGTIDNYAKEQLFRVSGTTGIGVANHSTLSLGTTTVGGAALSIALGVINYVSGPADVLSGSFTETGSGFTNTGFVPFANLGAQQNEHQQKVTLKTTTAGTFSETIMVQGTGSNSSGYSGALATQTITITGTVVAAGAILPFSTGSSTSSPGSFLLGPQTPEAAAPGTSPSSAEMAATPLLNEWLPGLSGADLAHNGDAAWGSFRQAALTGSSIALSPEHNAGRESAFPQLHLIR